METYKGLAIVVVLFVLIGVVIPFVMKRHQTDDGYESKPRPKKK